MIKRVNSPEVLFSLAVMSVYSSHWNMRESHMVGTCMSLSDSTTKTSRINLQVKAKCTLVQALRLCTGCTAQRGSRGIAVLFHDQRHQKGVSGQCQSPAALYPRERPGTHCTGDLVGPRAGLERCGKSRPTGIRSPDRPARSQSLPY